MPDVFEAKLLESGLTKQDAETLGIGFLSSLETKALNSSHKAHASLKINYFSPIGTSAKTPIGDAPSSPPYYRLRYLPVRSGFSAVTKLKKKYDNASGTLPVAYWPQNLDWGPVLDDVTKPVVIVEGELKAAKGCKEGFATIGLGGVDCWRARKRGVMFLDSLKFLKYERRDIYVCFDSDYLSNKNILRALIQFSDHLTSLGSFVHVVTLPFLNGTDKTGLDDYLVHCGLDAASNFNELLSHAQPIGLVRPLFDMNKKYTVLSSPTCVYQKYTEAKHKPEAFKNLLESHNHTLSRIPEASEKGDDTAKYKYKKVCVASEWLAWPLSDRCESLVYAPGKGEYIYKCIRDEQYVDYNCWSGFGATPVEGDVSLFIDLIDFLFKEAEPAHKEWFLQWLAYPIKYPGAKLYTACAIHGTKQGTGKTLVGYTVGGVYGNNYKEVNQDALEANFHKPFMNRQFILGDEITGSDQRKFSDKLKSYITGREIMINDKYVPQYYITNCINFYFTSNHPDAFYLEDTDRRFFIHQAPGDPLSRDFYKRYDKWYSNQDDPKTPRSEAMNAVMYYFLNLDTTSFDPHAPAPYTKSKEVMQELSKSDLGTWVHNAKLYPDETLGRSGRDVFNSTELLLLYDPMGKTRVTSTGVARELARSNIPKCNDGLKIRVNDSVRRYYILRNIDKWGKADVTEITTHLTTTKAVSTEEGKY